MLFYKRTKSKNFCVFCIIVMNVKKESYVAAVVMPEKIAIATGEVHDGRSLLTMENCPACDKKMPDFAVRINKEPMSVVNPPLIFKRCFDCNKNAVPAFITEQVVLFLTQLKSMEDLWQYRVDEKTPCADYKFFDLGKKVNYYKN